MSSTKNNDSIYDKIRKYLRANQIVGFNENQIIEKTAKVFGLSFEETSFAFGVLKTHRQIVSERIAEATINFVVTYEEEPEYLKNAVKKLYNNSEKLKSRSYRKPFAHSIVPTANNPLPKRITNAYNNPNYLKDYASRRPSSEIDNY